ncbi:2,3-bisphosphoglycerate-independent phosphoglycerate mutase [Methanocella paludicola SANAE]|uniref:phosphoglycerate mutase (2,3-diphosphoglycerate-independent) n=1 Tax=Methanocella paludicola (strain DSM 17711 / JCM 13418 / NBRC 101707 / SANAE) TaxID=304371 RepID=D1Z1E8_METPS|nr:cofactor-independent phosphoglycerate mutase [Methanocella paludicola]BAI62520.1 2,3-bisphosphoglycerate-independent phosphoglycerate mutase [Methanocella paludicola SANAE]
MKYAVILGDGMSDYPVEELDNNTPLMSARKPHMDFMAMNARHYGLCQTTVESLPAGSDVANLAVLGYDPARYYNGRGPLEAMSMGIKLRPDDVAFRCNLITVRDGLIADYSAGHVTSGEASELIRYVDREMGSNGTRFYPGISYRHLMVLDGKGAGAVCDAPHDFTGEPVESHLPRGAEHERLIEMIKRSWELLGEHPINKKRVREGKNPANSIWPWGQGRAPAMPKFMEKYGLKGSVISAVDLIKGLGVSAGLEVIEVPGATGYFDTDYRAKARYALESLEKNDFVFIHVEAPDEAGHEGMVREKVKAIEDLDSKVVGPMLEGMRKFGDFRLMVCPDHPTPLSIKTHARDPVPYIIYDSGRTGKPAEAYDEKTMKDGLFIKDGYRLMDLFINDRL